MNTRPIPMLLLLLGVVLIIGCSSRENPIETYSPEASSNSPSADHGSGGMLLGAYHINLNGSSMMANANPLRMPSAIGDAFLAGIAHTGPAGRWFDISGVELLSHDSETMKDVIRLKVRFQHPFDLASRPDLCGWDLKAILVHHYGTPISFPDLNVQMNPSILINAHGATREWDNESDLVYPTEADIHEYVIISEDSSVSQPFDFHNPSGWNVFYPGMMAEGNLDIQIDSGSSIEFMLFLTMGYEQSSTFSNTINHPAEPGSRGNPVYNPPNGNNRSPWKVEAIRTGLVMDDRKGSQTSYQVKIWDWQHAEPLSNSKVKRVQLSIPGVLSSPASVTEFSGNGRGSTPLVADIAIANDEGASEGDYPALIKVKDNLTGLPGAVTGIKTDWKTTFPYSEFDTYKLFMHRINHYDPVDTDLFDLALSEMDMVRDDLHWGSSANKFWRAGDEMYFFQQPTGVDTKMPDFTGDNGYHKNPLNFPGYAESYIQDLRFKALSRDYSGILMAMSKRLGYPIDSIDYSYTPTTHPLLDALADLHHDIGDPLSQTERTTIQNDANDIPESVQIIAAKCLTAAALAHLLRESAWASFDPSMKTEVYNGNIYFDPLENLDYSKLNQAGAEIAEAFKDIRPDLESFADAGVYDFDWTTPIGRVLIKGDTDNTYQDDNYLLLMDVGGNDTYSGKVSGNGSLENSVSMAIDFSGNDTYGDDTTVKSTGGAYMGLAAHWDFSGDDNYFGDFYNQGAAYFGCGFCIDSSGDDHYNSDQAAQGCGYWGGTAYLLDEAGVDNYYTFQLSQGFGYVRGCGALIDVVGDDSYIADDTDIRYPSAQSAEHNASLSQGTGFGLRADPQFLGGGLGTLLDLGGSDDYSCGVFGQGCAFMFSTGILADLGFENDSFHGIWYVQSATAHMGVSYFSNEGGNDTYECVMNVGQGGAHDFSHSWFFDYSGDDIYTAPGISLGGGNECGLGIFIDYDGVDTYHCNQASSVGGANFSSGRNRNSYGVFVDDGEDTDIYDKPLCANNSSWHDGGIGGGADGHS